MRLLTMNYLLPLAKPESVPTVPGSHEYSTHRATTKSHDAVNWDDFPSQDPDTLGRQLSELGKIFASGQGLPEELRADSDLTARAFAIAYTAIKNCDEDSSGKTSLTLLDNPSDHARSKPDDAREMRYAESAASQQHADARQKPYNLVLSDHGGSDCVPVRISPESKSVLERQSVEPLSCGDSRNIDRDGDCNCGKCLEKWVEWRRQAGHDPQAYVNDGYPGEASGIMSQGMERADAVCLHNMLAASQDRKTEAELRPILRPTDEEGHNQFQHLQTMIHWSRKGLWFDATNYASFIDTVKDHHYKLARKHGDAGQWLTVEEAEHLDAVENYVVGRYSPGPKPDHFIDSEDPPLGYVEEARELKDPETGDVVIHINHGMHVVRNDIPDRDQYARTMQAYEAAKSLADYQDDETDEGPRMLLQVPNWARPTVAKPDCNDDIPRIQVLSVGGYPDGVPGYRQPILQVHELDGTFREFRLRDEEAKELVRCPGYGGGCDGCYNTHLYDERCPHELHSQLRD